GSSQHSLHYQYVVVSEPSEGLPQFFTMGYLDDQLITYYDSQKNKKIPKVSWMSEVDKEDPEYWKDGSRILEATKRVLQEDLRKIQKRYHQDGGLHTWQTTYGCELRGNSSIRGYSQYGYDGKTFLTFNKETLSWGASDPQAQITKRNWDANLQWSQRNKFYLEEECIEWLKNKMEAKDGMETHVCRLDGFYPREIDASWTRDGEVWLEGTFHGSLAPNADGTYHYWLSIQIDPKERGHYRCHVEHDGLQEPLDLAINEPTSSKSNVGLIIIGCVVAALVLVGVIAGILVFFKKHQDGYKAATTSDKGSNSSDWIAISGFSQCRKMEHETDCTFPPVIIAPPITAHIL
ncbi:putative MHC class I antigen protein, partial [Naja naja]